MSDRYSINIKRAIRLHSEPESEPYWMSEIGEASFSYCARCIDKALREEATGTEFESLDDEDLWHQCGGGGYGTESDTPEYCEMCGAALRFSATEHCQKEELAHFATYGITSWGEVCELERAIDLTFERGEKGDLARLLVEYRHTEDIDWAYRSRRAVIDYMDVVPEAADFLKRIVAWASMGRDRLLALERSGSKTPWGKAGPREVWLPKWAIGDCE